MRVISWLLDLLFPPKCVFCGHLLKDRESDMCADCRTSLPRTEGDIGQITFCKKAYSLFYYEKQVPDSIRRYKFAGRSNYASAYGRLLAMEILRKQIPFDVLTFVPVSAKRRRKRGYDQAELLAKAVAKELKVPVCRCLLKRRDNRAQSSLADSSERSANVRGVYRGYRAERYTGKKLLLIDDVLTTGATVSECCNVLRLSGASEVRCLTVAAARKIFK